MTISKRTFSKYKIMTYLMEKNLWTQVKDWILTSGYADFWDVPLNFLESDPYFIQGISAFKTQFGITDEQLEEMLQNCIMDNAI